MTTYNFVNKNNNFKIKKIIFYFILYVSIPISLDINHVVLFMNPIIQLIIEKNIMFQQ